MSIDEQLTEVNAAISAILNGGSEYRIGSRFLKRADLGMLYKIKNDLDARKAQENSGGLLDDCYVGIFDGR